MTDNELRGTAGRSFMLVIILVFSLGPMLTGHPEWSLPLVIAATITATANFIVEFAAVLKLEDDGA